MNLSLKPNLIMTMFIILGFSIMMAQVVMLRELIVLFTGNELTLGIMLGVWLLWTAIGSGCASRVIPHLKHPLFIFIFCQLTLAALLPMTIVFIRFSKQIFSLSLGEMTPPYFIFIIPLLALAPICTLAGFLYALACRILAQAEVKPALVPGRVYLLEGIGAGIAGFIASMIFFRYLENLEIVAIICVLNLALVFFVVSMIKQKLVMLWLLSFLVLMSLIILSFLRIDRLLQQKTWGAMSLLHSQNSIHGQVTVTRLGESISFFENGTLMFTNPDLMSAEESVHFALLEHPQPQSALLIGGDPSGSLPQVLFHPSITHVDFVTLDPTVIHLAKDFIPSLDSLWQDRRIYIWHQDGRLFLKQSQIKYDVIIINLPEPQTTLINRFFTLEFYQSARQKLTSAGVLSFSLPASENVLSKEQQIFLSCLFKTICAVFEDVMLIPGNSIHFIGCASDSILTRDPQILIERLNQRQLPTMYMREYYIPFRMEQARMAYISDQIEPTRSAIINRDFQPIGYFYSMILWLTSFNLKPERIFHLAYRWGSYLLAPVLLIMLFWWFLRFRRQKNDATTGVWIAIFTIGFTSISLEVLIILGFQAIYGYAYYQLSLIISGFMMGITFGSWLGIALINRMRANFSRFLHAQFSFSIYPLVMYMALFFLSKIIVPGFMIQILFLILIFGAGFIGGFQFPIANHLLYSNRGHVEIIGGTLYAWDLAGSVVGAILTSTLLIPLLGIGATILILSGFNLFVFMMLWVEKFVARKSPTEAF